MSFLDSSAPDPGVHFLEELRKQCPGVFLVLFRNKNHNVVVYEAILNDEKTGFHHETPVQVYWLDVDPEYRQPKRAKGIETDREELSFFERQIGLYNFSVERKDARNLLFRLAAQPNYDMVVKLNENGRVKALTKYNSQPYYVSHLYIDASENPLKLLNNIRSIQFHGVHLKTQQPSSFALDIQR